MHKTRFSSLILALMLGVAIPAMAQDAPTAQATPSGQSEQGSKPSTAQTGTQSTPNNGSTSDKSEQATDGEQATAQDVPPSPHSADAPTIAEIIAPNDSELSKANAELLVKNAELERKVGELTTQVNVLTHERSGQLFLYGALTVLATIVLSVLAITIIAHRNQRSRW